MIDKAALVAHIRAKAAWSNLRIQAALSALATAIERGDFDTETDGFSGADIHSPETQSAPEPSGSMFDAHPVIHKPSGADQFESERLRSEGGAADDMVQS